MAVIDLNDSNFESELAQSELAVVDFYASWCGPCLMFAPIFKAMAKQIPDVGFFKLDSESSPNARASVQIPGLPYFAIYKKGQFVEGVATSKHEKIRALIAKHRDEA